jgi:hypothetical protein
MLSSLERWRKCGYPGTFANLDGNELNKEILNYDDLFGNTSSVYEPRKLQKQAGAELCQAQDLFIYFLFYRLCGIFIFSLKTNQVWECYGVHIPDLMMAEFK